MAAAGRATVGWAFPEWPSNETLVASGTATGSPLVGRLPWGAAIRNWGQTDQVYIVVDQHDYAPNTDDLRLYEYFCSNNDVCATATENVISWSLGSAIPFGNIGHPSMAIRSPSNGVIELLVAGRQKIDTDCNNDGLDGGNDFVDSEALELMSWKWTSTGGLVSSKAIESNDNGQCKDTGFSEARFLGGTSWACYSFVPNNQPNTQNLRCNDNSVVGTWQWTDAVDMTRASNVEDHPSFDFYTNNDLAVAGHSVVVNGDDEVRVHFPDHTAPPNEPIVAFAATASDTAQHPWIVSGNGLLQRVWYDGLMSAAKIKYASCDYSATQDCTTNGAWTVSEVVTADGAKMPQIDTDGKNQFVVYQFDNDPGPGQEMRVVVATRCEGEASWSYNYVRDSAAANGSDQTVLFGRPSIVLNRAEHIVNVVFIEADEYTNGDDLADARDTKVYWARKGYTPCLP